MEKILFGFEWVKAHEVILGWLGLLSLIFSLVFIMAVPIIIIKLPADYFQRYTRDKGTNAKTASFSHLFYQVFKNIFGTVLLLAGLAMLVLPGQGLLTIIIGLSLLSIPGKRVLLLKILRKRNTLRAMNRLRSKFDKPALKV